MERQKQISEGNIPSAEELAYEDRERAKKHKSPDISKMKYRVDMGDSCKTVVFTDSEERYQVLLGRREGLRERKRRYDENNVKWR